MNIGDRMYISDCCQHRGGHRDGALNPQRGENDSFLREFVRLLSVRTGQTVDGMWIFALSSSSESSAVSEVAAKTSKGQGDGAGCWGYVKLPL